jgi:GNAT superfamily N-acetyltransferase
MAANDSAERPIHFEEINAATHAHALEQARTLMLEYGRFVIAQPGAARFCFGALEREAAGLPQSYLEQGGGCLLAQVAGNPEGFVAWRAIEPTDKVEADAWEMKRLWVRPSARGLGLGRKLSQAVLDRARAARRKAVYLDTAPASMGAAHRIYLELGFEPCGAYNNNPVEGLAYLKKRL